MEKLKCMYLCAKEHRIDNGFFEFFYNDIEEFEGITHCCSCQEVDLSKYDVFIATPPCNYYSRANYRREFSKIAQLTKHLLPWCIRELAAIGKPFLVENVCNASLVPQCHEDLYQFTFGNHTFYSNVFFLTFEECCAVAQHKADLPYGHRDNNVNVHMIIDLFLDEVSRRYVEGVPLVDYPARVLEVKGYEQSCDDDQ